MKTKKINNTSTKKNHLQVASRKPFFKREILWKAFKRRMKTLRKR